MEFGYTEWKGLEKLLHPPHDSSDSEDDLPRCGMAKLGPGDIGESVKTGTDDKKEAEPVDSSSIWNPEEVLKCEVPVCDVSTDPRQKPEYNIKFRQAVTPEDIYLQMGGRTTATSSCEDMVVSIALPGEQFGNVNLDVRRNTLDVRSPVYRLALALPQPADPNSSRAQWDEDTEKLIVTLRMDREFDFVNF